MELSLSARAVFTAWLLQLSRALLLLSRALRFPRPFIYLGLDTINHRHKRNTNGCVVTLDPGGIRQTPVMFVDLTHPQRAGLSGRAVTNGNHTIRFKALKIMPRLAL